MKKIAKSDKITISIRLVTMLLAALSLLLGLGLLPKAPKSPDFAWDFVNTPPKEFIISTEGDITLKSTEELRSFLYLNNSVDYDIFLRKLNFSNRIFDLYVSTAHRDFLDELSAMCTGYLIFRSGSIAISHIIFKKINVIWKLDGLKTELNNIDNRPVYVNMQPNESLIIRLVNIYQNKPLFNINSLDDAFSFQDKRLITAYKLMSIEFSVFTTEGHEFKYIIDITYEIDGCHIESICL